MSEYIAPKTAAEVGLEFTVSSAVGVKAYGNNGAEMIGIVMVINSDATAEPLTSRINPSQSAVEVRLSGVQKHFTITEPGTYRIDKFTTVGTVGIDTEGS